MSTTTDSLNATETPELTKPTGKAKGRPHKTAEEIVDGAPTVEPEPESVKVVVQGVRILDATDDAKVIAERARMEILGFN